VSRAYAGKTAVVTGAGSGIGGELALNLAGRGARLALSDVNAEAAAATAAQCRTRGAVATSWRLDVAERTAMFAHADDVVAEFGTVDLVINNAGVSVNGRVSELTDTDHRWIMGINYWGMVHGTQAFLPHLAASSGQLANVSSVFGLIAFPGQSAYNASKFAIRGFTEALRMELAADKVPVAVSLVHPGGIKTNITRNASRARRTARRRSLPSTRWLSPPRRRPPAPSCAGSSERGPASWSARTRGLSPRSRVCSARVTWVWWLGSAELVPRHTGDDIARLVRRCAR